MIGTSVGMDLRDLASVEGVDLKCFSKQILHHRQLNVAWIKEVVHFRRNVLGEQQSDLIEGE